MNMPPIGTVIVWEDGSSRPFTATITQYDTSRLMWAVEFCDGSVGYYSENHITNEWRIATPWETTRFLDRLAAVEPKAVPNGPVTKLHPHTIDTDETHIIRAFYKPYVDNMPKNRHSWLTRLVCSCQACYSDMRRVFAAAPPEIVVHDLSTTSSKPTTQKAKGIQVIINNWNMFPGLSYPEYAVLVQRQTQILPAWSYLENCGVLSVFGRPAPTIPHHGFEPSIPLSTPEAAKQLFLRARALDPQAELILMKQYKAHSSAILVAESGRLAIGAGHDGATGAKPTIDLPVGAFSFPKWLTQNAQVPPSSHSYIEVVQEEGTTHGIAVQLRAGPPVSGTMKDYVPKAFVVQRIIRPTDDLTAWEKETDESKNEEGLVAYAPLASLASHAAVHCSENGIPFITTFEPQIGSLIEPTIDESIFPFDRKEFRRGMMAATQLANNIHIKDYDPGHARFRLITQPAVAILHNLVVLKQCRHWSRLAGFMAMGLFLGAAAACIGEARHCTIHDHDDQIVTECDHHLSEDCDCTPSLNREQVYKKASYTPPPELAELLASRARCFIEDGAMKGGLGHIPWFDASVQTMMLYNYMVSGNLQRTIKASNKVVNSAHNNGWLFNKFMSDDLMNTAAAKPGLLMAASASQLRIIIDGTFGELKLPKRKHRESRSWTLNSAVKHGGVLRATVDNRRWLDLEWPQHRPLLRNALTHI